jgi:glycosyltransferase involved in cell wall biosynthesis
VGQGGGPKFLVDSRENGFIAGDFAGFVEAVMELHSHRAMRDRMARAARNTATSHSWDRVFEKVYARYATLLPREATERSRPMPLAMVP